MCQMDLMLRYFDLTENSKSKVLGIQDFFTFFHGVFQNGLIAFEWKIKEFLTGSF